MKLIICILGIILSSNAVFGQLTNKIIGINESGVYRITVDRSELKQILENQLSREDNKTSIYKIFIRKDTIEGTGDKEYYTIYGQNKIGNIKTAVDIELKGNAFIAKYSKSKNVFSSYITCFGACINGCYPKKSLTPNGYPIWKCTACPQRPEACKKSVTTNAY
jgi:hypothetical protein